MASYKTKWSLSDSVGWGMQQASTRLDYVAARLRSSHTLRLIEPVKQQCCLCLNKQVLECIFRKEKSMRTPHIRIIKHKGIKVQCTEIYNLINEFHSRLNIVEARRNELGDKNVQRQYMRITKERAACMKGIVKCE